MSEPKIGDRYEWSAPVRPARAKIIEWVGNHWFIVEGPKKGSVFTEEKILFDMYYWKFIGNYSKDTNFNVLYDIMNS